MGDGAEDRITLKTKMAWWCIHDLIATRCGFPMAPEEEGDPAVDSDRQREVWSLRQCFCRLL